MYFYKQQLATCTSGTLETHVHITIQDEGRFKVKQPGTK